MPATCSPAAQSIAIVQEDPISSAKAVSFSINDVVPARVCRLDDVTNNGVERPAGARRPAKALDRRVVTPAASRGAMLQRLARARSLDAELAALIADLKPEHQRIVLDRWGAGYDVTPTLHAVGRMHNASREYVRGVMDTFEAWLEGMQLVLPIGTQIVQYIGRRRGRATAQTLSLHLEALSVDATATALQALPALSLLGLVPVVDRFEGGTLGIG